MSSLDTSILQAATEGDLAKLQNLVEKQGGNVNCQGALNRTPLHLASLYGKLDVVLYLIERKAQLNAQASSGEGNLIFLL